MKGARNGSIFKQLEKFADEKFQDNLGEILSAVGFDTKTAIRSFSNPQTFIDIEKYINENRQRFDEILNGTKYERADTFKFLPGHTALLKGLPDHLNLLQEKKQKKTVVRNQPNKRILNAIGIQPIGVRDNQNNNQNTEADAAVSIRQLLILKIENFATRKKFKSEIGDANILNFRSEDNKYKCSVQCPFCNRIPIPCIYTSNWICGNFTTHLSTHFVLEEYEINEENEVLKVVGDGREKIHRLGNQHDLENILNE